MSRPGYGPESQIKVDRDEFPNLVTTVLVDDRGQPKLFTAYGERAGDNLVDGIYKDSDYRVIRIDVVDYTNISMAGIAGLMPRDEFVD